MTDKRNGLPLRFGVRAALAFNLALVGLLGVSPLTARAATIKAHPFLIAEPHSLKDDIAEIQRVLQGWKTQAEASRPVSYLRGLTLNNPDGTPRSPALARLVRWEQAHHLTLPGTVPARVAPLASQQAQLHSQNQAAQVAATISAAPKSSAFMVLVPPTTAGETPTTPGAVTVEAQAPSSISAAPVLAQQEMPVPEPSSVLTTLALLGLAGGWCRLRGAPARRSA